MATSNAVFYKPLTLVIKNQRNHVEKKITLPCICIIRGYIGVPGDGIGAPGFGPAICIEPKIQDQLRFCCKIKSENCYFLQKMYFFILK